MNFQKVSKEAIVNAIQRHADQVLKSTEVDSMLVLIQHDKETTFTLIGDKEALTNAVMSACVHNPEFSVLLGDVVQNVLINWSVKEMMEEKELERMKHGNK